MIHGSVPKNVQSRFSVFHKYLSHLLYELSLGRSVGNHSAIEGQTANTNSRTVLWARCSTSLLFDSERSLKSLMAETRRRVTLATNYFFINQVLIYIIIRNLFAKFLKTQSLGLWARLKFLLKSKVALNQVFERSSNIIPYIYSNV